jgi:hypothetical protein
MGLTLRPRPTFNQYFETIEHAQASGAKFVRNIHGDEINRIKCRSIWETENAKHIKCKEYYVIDHIIHPTYGKLFEMILPMEDNKPSINVYSYKNKHRCKSDSQIILLEPVYLYNEKYYVSDKNIRLTSFGTKQIKKRYSSFRPFADVLCYEGIKNIDNG